MEKENGKMKNERETRSGTAAKLANRETNTIIFPCDGISVSETARSVIREMNKNTPANELLIRGWS